MDKLPQPPRDATVTLREVTSETLRPVMDLKVSPAQRNFVAPNARSIAEAHFEPERAWFRAIYADETPVGFVMVFINRDDHKYGLWRLMVDEQHQGKGFGFRAVQQVIEFVRTLPNATEMMVSYVAGDGSPHQFYKKLGFEDTGAMLGDEHVMLLYFD